MENKKVLRKRPKKENISQISANICHECGSTDFEYDNSRAEVICRCCGLILDENIIDQGPDWVAYDPDQRNSRAHTGAPVLIGVHDGGLPTDMGKISKPASSHNAVNYYRLRKWNRKIRVSGSKERNLAFALTQLDRKCSNLALPRGVRESASKIYKDALEEKLIRGRTVESVLAAAIYIACREHKIPRTLAEIESVSEVSRKQIARTHKFLQKKLNIKLALTSPSDYIPRFASQLNLSGELEAKAISIIEESKKAGLNNGKAPGGLAAAAIYIAAVLLNERKSQKLVAEVAGVTEVTVRNRYRELSENLNLGVTI